MRILDHLEPLPEGGLDAFITRLEDTEDKVRQNLRSYVVADAVRERLDVTLREVGGRLADGRDLGRTHDAGGMRRRDHRRDGDGR